MAARTFIWITIGGGTWSLAANWEDVTDGLDPSALVPGPQDSVSISGSSGTQVMMITGTGSVAAALFTGNTSLAGTFAAGTLTIGTSSTGGMLQLAAGTSLASGSAVLAAGSLLVDGTNAVFSVSGTLGIGDGLTDGLSANLNVTGGGFAESLGLLMDVANCEIYVDPVSVLEVGGLGTGQQGYLTIDPGALLAGQGNADAYGDVANNGTIEAAGGTLAVGALSGTGTLAIEMGATLELNGVCGQGQTVQFAGANGVLDLQAEYYAPAGAVIGFAAGDAIDVSGSLISSAGFAPAGSGGGVLTLFYGSQVADQITLTGNYVGSTFLTAGDGEGGTLITVAPAESSGGTPSPGTSTPDQYLWVAQGSGEWKTAGNWRDQSTGADPARIAPGVNDSVSIAGSTGSFTVIGGPANAAALSLTGEVALAGAYAIGTLAVGAVSGTEFAAGVLDLLPGAVLAAAAGTIAAGAIDVAGAGASLSVAGTLVLGGGASGVGLPVTALTVTSGGAVQSDALTIGGGSGDSITTDPTSSVEIGTLGGAAAGAVTIDAGASLTGNGVVDPFGTIIDNGTVTASGGVLEMGSVTGTGHLYIGIGTLELNEATRQTVWFTSANSTLAVAGTGALPTGGIGAMLQGDAIDILGDPITSLQFTANAGATSGTLWLSYGTTVVGEIAVHGHFAGEQFITLSDGQEGTLIELVAQTGGTGGTGQSGTDQLSWTGAAKDGNWSTPVNWRDTTINAVATAPPGAETPASFAGPTGQTYQSVSGTGTCASLALTGNVAFQGQISIGTLDLGQDATATAAAIGGTLATAGTASFSIGTALAADGLIQLGTGTDFDVAGTLALGDGGGSPALVLQGGASAAMGALTLGGGSVAVDAYSSLEVGTLGGLAAGTLAVDPGCTVSGAGVLNVAGATVDNGTIAAAGGTLFTGSVSGTGVLETGTEATLDLGAGVSAPIHLIGAGSKLILQSAALPPATIWHFFPGDSIVIGDTPVDTVSYTPKPSGIGILTLSEAGQTVGTLHLTGNFAADVFSVAPDGAGSVITVAAGPVGTGGPPAGTTSPDQYVWTGGQGTLWATAANWADITAGQSPAAVAPGQNDLVTIAATGSVAQSVTGPADASELSLTGTVALGGAVAAGLLAIGAAQQTGVLALGSGDVISAAAASVQGGITGAGGTLAVEGALTLGVAAGAAGIADATEQTTISAGSVLLQGPGSALITDQSSSIEIGGAAGAAAGSVTIDPTGVLQGAGAVDPSGTVVDNGTIAAGGGTLALGTVSGSGTLLVGPDASLLLEGAATAGLTVDFAGAGTLVCAAGFAAALMDFGPSDVAILPVSGATSAAYALEAPGVGLLTLLDGSQVLQQLTLLGDAGNEVFAVSPTAGGGTALTATPANMAGTGGETVQNDTLTSGANTLTAGQMLDLAEEEFPYAVPYVEQLDNGPGGSQSVFVWQIDTVSPVAGPPPFGNGQIAGTDYEIVAATAGDVGLATDQILASGYQGLIAEGTEQVNLFDQSVGNALLVGNANSDPQLPTSLQTYMNNDTLVGAVGGNTLFWAQDGERVSIQGGGNDTIITNLDNASITTSEDNHSLVFLGPSDNEVLSMGHDYIICNSTISGIAQDTVTVGTPSGQPGPIVFSPSSGIVSVVGGAAPAIMVGNGGQIVMDGGSGAGGILWTGDSNAEYFGGAGSAVVIGGSGHLYMQGGTGPVTVYGGTGSTTLVGGASNSVYVVGEAPTTIAAGAGNVVNITGSAPVSVAGASGLVVYAGLGTGSYVFDANAGSETLWGGAASDQFFAGSGNDNMVSGGGADIFNFTNGLGGGSDIIYNFVPGRDTIALHGYGSGVPALSEQSGNTYFSLPDGTRVEMFGLASLPSSAFSMS